MPMTRLTTLLLVAWITGCSSAGTVSEPAAESDSAVPPDTAAAETFDISPYGDVPARVTIRFEHDVPDALMENRADAGIEITVDGFRVQIFSTLDQEEAAAAQEEAKAFWRETVDAEGPDSGLPGELPVYGFFRQPYYRIRVGDFTDRAEADRVATLLARRFEGALVVPDQVTFVK